MNDCFALLNEPRRPWLDTESLKTKFFSLSAAFHPDRVHGGTQAEKSAAQQRYAELNAAYNRLRDPKERLLHFLEKIYRCRIDVQPDAPEYHHEFYFYSEVKDWKSRF